MQTNPSYNYSPWFCLKADTIRQYNRYSPLILLFGAITRRTFRPIVTMRLCQIASTSLLSKLFILPFLRIAHRIATTIACIDLSWRTTIGPGLILTHAWGLVISPGAIIGNNVTIFHGATIGRRDKISTSGNRKTEYPLIEDQVWIGPHAVVIGGIKIGNGSRIAAGAFVTENVPPFSVVVGNPASIVKQNCSPDVMNPAPLP